MGIPQFTVHCHGLVKFWRTFLMKDTELLSNQFLKRDFSEIQVVLLRQNARKSVFFSIYSF